MALDKDIVGSIEFLEVVGLQGSTYLLKGPNDESVKLNQSEVADEDDFELGEEYSFFRLSKPFRRFICDAKHA